MMNFTIKKLILFFFDSVIFWLALFLALFIRRSDIFNFAYFSAHVHTFIFVYIVFILSIFISGLYDVPEFISRLQKIKLLFYTSVTSFIFGALSFYLMPSDYTPKVVLLFQSIIVFVLISSWRLISEKVFSNKNKTKALLMDDSLDAEDLFHHINNNDYNIQFVENISPKVVSLSFAETFKNIILRDKIELIVGDLTEANMQNILPIVYELKTRNSKIKIQSTRDFYQYVYKKMPLKTVGYHWFFESVTLEAKVYHFIKRMVDIVVAVPILFLLAFLHPWVARKIKQEDGGEVYSVQERLGKHAKKIYIKKYRTMSFTDAGMWPGEHKENKITEVGHFLRKTRIDELPQIFSVLRGDLTLIGPRTDLSNLGEKLAEEIDYYNLRYSVTPGLSGWAQTMMHKPPSSLEETIERLRYDLYYVKNRSLALDFIIGLKTIKTILSREGA